MISLSNIEARVLKVIDQQKRKQPCEDSCIEMKADWPEPIKAARQIAGHANAARGENILWIIGVDESNGIVGADNTELANWLPQVKSYFDGLFPDVIDLNVPVDDKTIVALLFSSDRAPFVVKNSAYGKPASGSVELEVPWREGRRTRSARREDLIRLLVPISRQPSIEVISSTVTITELHPIPDPSYCNWHILVRLYIAPFDHDRVVIPFHHCDIVITVGEDKISVCEKIRLSPSGRYYFGSGKIDGEVDSFTIASTESEVIADGPGRLNVSAYVKAARPNSIAASDIALTLRMRPVGAEKPLTIETHLNRVKPSDNEKFVAKWEYGKEE
jgi:hypothetical protein